MSSKRTDQELVALVVSGEQDFFAEIYERYNGKIQGRVYQLVDRGLSRECDDILQDIWIKIFKSLKNYDPGKAGLSTYIYRIAYSECVDFLRSKWRKQVNKTSFDADLPLGYEDDERGVSAMGSEDYIADPIKYYAVKQAMKIMFSKLDELPEPLRNLLVMRFVANVSEKDIASHRGTTTSSVRSNVSRASALLIEKMRDLANPEDVVKILCKGSFVFTEKEVEMIKDKKIRKFLEVISIKRAPMAKIFKSLKCDSRSSRQALMDGAAAEILKFQRSRKMKKIAPEKIVEALFAAAGRIVKGEAAEKPPSPGTRILLAAKQKKISMDGLADKLGLDPWEMTRVLSGRTDASKKPALAAKIKLCLGIPLSQLRASADDRLMLSFRSKTEEAARMANVRKNVFRKLGIKQI